MIGHQREHVFAVLAMTALAALLALSGPAFARNAGGGVGDDFGGISGDSGRISAGPPGISIGGGGSSARISAIGDANTNRPSSIDHNLGPKPGSDGTDLDGLDDNQGPDTLPPLPQ